MTSAADLTPREVAELAGVPKRAIEKAIEEKVLPVHTGKIAAMRFGKAADARRFLGIESVAYATVMRRLTGDVTLTISGKRKLVKALKRHELSHMKTAHIEIAPSVTADVGELAGDALERADRYLRARETWIGSVAGIKGGGCPSSRARASPSIRSRLASSMATAWTTSPPKALICRAKPSKRRSCSPKPILLLDVLPTTRGSRRRD